MKYFANLPNISTVANRISSPNETYEVKRKENFDFLQKMNEYSFIKNRYEEQLKDEESIKYEDISSLKELKFPLKNIVKKEIWIEDDNMPPCVINSNNDNNKFWLVEKDGVVKNGIYPNGHLWTPVYATGKGYFYLRNEGEFGGNVYHYTSFGEEHLYIENPVFIHIYNNSAFILTSIGHMTIESFELWEVKFFEDRYEKTLVLTSGEYNISNDTSFFAKDNMLYLVVYNKVIAINLDDKSFKEIEGLVIPNIKACSLVVLNDKVYVGGEANLIVFDINTKEEKFYTNLTKNSIIDNLYVDGMKLLDIWDYFEK